MELSVKDRVVNSITEVLPKTYKVCLWLIKITVGISFGILILRYFNVLPWFSKLIAPFFNLFGLSGEAALAFVSGYFVNVYSAIAVIGTLGLNARAATIIGVMVLCAHNMITETAVLKKTGSSPLRMVIIRTGSAFLLGFILNRIMPGSSTLNAIQTIQEEHLFMPMLREWSYSTLFLVLKMSTLVFLLSIMQKLLAEFGVIKFISNLFRPLLHLFGLPAKTSFLWIVANVLGLAYGAAVMIEEYENGKISKEENDLLNHHIAISHSNLEDMILLVSVGGMFLWMLLSRWAMSMILVWGLRVELYLRKKIVSL